MITINIPEITEQIGRGANSVGIKKLVNTLKKTKFNSTDEKYVVFMTFNLVDKTIRFESPIPFSENMLYRFNYLGNNARQSAQFNLVREIDSLSYLLSSVWNDLMLTLKRYQMTNSNLYSLIQELEENNIITLGTNKGEGSICWDKLIIPSLQQSERTIQVELGKKNVTINEQQLNFEKLISISLGTISKHQRFVLAIPQIYADGESPIILSETSAYVELVERVNKLGVEEYEEILGDQSNRVCYICHRRMPNVSNEYPKNKGDGINNLFTVTKVNFAKGIKKAGHDDCYSVCSACNENRMVGEKLIAEKFLLQIVNERTFVLPEGLLGRFDYESLNKLKEDVDLAFKSKEAEQWLTDIEAEGHLWQNGLYSLNFIMHRSDGNSISILESIEDVPTLRFIAVMKLFKQHRGVIHEHLKGMSLGSIYRIIPVRTVETNGKRVQVDIKRVLNLYKAILSGSFIGRRVLYEYATEALDKGLKQLNKRAFDNYENMQLSWYKEHVDFFIKKIIMSHLVLFHVCQDLSILEQNIFITEEKEDEKMPENLVQVGNNTEKSIAKMEDFLRTQGYTRQAKALFYLGGLLWRVGVEQSKKGHKSKPILEKISFQGMTFREIQFLYEAVLEKLRQYNIMTYFSEMLISKFHEHFASLKDLWPLDEHANVFYIMSGYAYLVGNKSQNHSNSEQPEETDETEDLEEDSILDEGK